MTDKSAIQMLQEKLKQEDLFSQLLWNKEELLYDSKKLRYIEELKALWYTNTNKLYVYALKKDRIESMMSIIQQYAAYHSLQQQNDEDENSQVSQNLDK